MKIPRSLLLLVPLAVALGAYAGVMLPSPIPVDQNSPILFISALTGKPNLLSYLVGFTLGVQPSLVIFILVSSSVAILYGSTCLLLREAGVGLPGTIVSLSLLLTLPFLNFGAFTSLVAILIPAALASLGMALAMRGKRRNVTVGVALVVASAFIAPAFSFAAGLSAILWAAISWRKDKDEALNCGMFANGSILAGLGGLTLVRPIESLQPVPAFLYPTHEPVFYLLLAGMSGLGLYLAWRRDPTFTLKVASWAFVSIVVSWTGITGALVLMAVPLALLSSYPVAFGVAGLASTKREGEEQVVEVDALKLAALLLVGAVVLSSVSGTLSNAASYLPVGASDVKSLLDVAAFLNGRNSSVIAPLSLLPWLSVYSGQRLASDDPYLLDSWSQTSFRVQSGSVRVDDWEPFSASRAPRIAIFDGLSFKYLLYVDDSYVRFTVSYGNQSWVESPYGMAYLGYRQLNDTSIEMDFQSRWLQIKKVISAVGSIATISYQFSALRGVSVRDVQVSVFGDWPYTIDSFRGEGDRSFITAGGRSFGLTAPVNSTAAFLEQQHSVRLSEPFGSSSGAFSLAVECYDALQSGGPSFTSSIFDFFNTKGESFVVAKSDNPDRYSSVSTSYLQSLYLVDSYQSVSFEVSEPIGFEIGDSYVRANFYTYTQNTAPLMSIVDAYMRASFTAGGGNYVEAPSDGRVLSEALNGTDRFVTYETSGLLINKTLTYSNGSLGLEYLFRAKEGNVTSVDGYLWLPWGMDYSYSLGPGYVMLKAPMGSFNISYAPYPDLTVDVGPHPPGGQPSIRFSGPVDRLVLRVTAIQPLNVTYIPTTRPKMNGSDVVQVEAPYLMGPWQEAPHGAAIQERGRGFVRAQDKALSYVISFNSTNDGVDVKYRFSPKGGTLLSGGWALVWLNLNLDQVDHSFITDGFRTVGLRVGGYDITAGPEPTSVSLSKSESGTAVLNVTFSGGELEIHIGGRLNASYIASPGPSLADVISVQGVLPTRYAESPSNAVVLQEQSSVNERMITYETAGLLFTKRVQAQPNNSISISYEASAKGEKETLVEAKSVIWIPWERLLLNYSIGESGLTLSLDSGEVNLSFSPRPSNISYVADPQPSFVLTYEIPYSSSFNYTMVVRSSTNSPISVTFQDSSRPVEDSSDVIRLNVLYGFLQMVYQAGDIRVYRVIKP